MEEETNWNLKEKRIPPSLNCWCYYELDVEEFLKRLKEEIEFIDKGFALNKGDVLSAIDKLSGGLGISEHTKNDSKEDNNG